MVKIENRFVKDIKKILYDVKWLKTAPNFKVYEVKRGIKFEDGLRYDETIIYPRLLGQEFPKTKGHEHPKEYQELIKVIKGSAIFLLQNDEKNTIKDIYFIQAKRNQAIISPAGYSHTTINASKKVLEIGTWIEDVSASEYGNIKTHQGFGYYYTLTGWQKNKNYKRTLKLKEKKPLKKILKNLNFLNSRS